VRDAAEPARCGSHTPPLPPGRPYPDKDTAVSLALPLLLFGIGSLRFEQLGLTTAAGSGRLDGQGATAPIVVAEGA